MPSVALVSHHSPCGESLSTEPTIEAAVNIPHRRRPLLEVFNVSVDKLADGHPSSLIYGNITVRDSLGFETLWTHPKENPVSICSGEDILLEGPSRRLSAADPLYIDLDIRYVPIAIVNSTDAPTESASIAKECVIFNPFSAWGVEYGKVIRRFDGEHGTVTLDYMTLRDGLSARIQIVLLNDRDNEDLSSNVRLCGSITTDNEHGKSELFRKVKSSGQCVTVSSNSSIPLSRAVVAAPWGGTLRIKALLQNYDGDLASPGEAVVQGVVAFEEASYMKSEMKIIEGYDGWRLALSVLWKR